MNPAFDLLSPQQWNVLKALGIYRFLTVEQMLNLGISRNSKSLRDKSLFALRHYGHIHTEKIGAFLPDVHHLTPSGRQAIIEHEGIDPGEVPENKRQAYASSFAQHRFAQVDFHIGLRRWADHRGDADVILELQDFVRRPKPATSLGVPGDPKPIIPDGAFGVRLTSSKTALFLAEIHRATQSRSVYEQLKRYFEVIKTGAAQEKFGVTAHPIICSIHHQASVLASVKKRLMADATFEPFCANFVFREATNLRDDFSDGWHFADGHPAVPFPMPNPKPNENL